MMYLLLAVLLIMSLGCAFVLGAYYGSTITAQAALEQLDKINAERKSPSL